jgi:DNA mismatch repair ATPase MutS
MSKLIKQYEELKKRDSNKVYIFPVGIFYNILNEDARIVSNAIGLKLTNLSPEIIKCGFPISQKEKYSLLLKNNNITFEFVSPTSSDQKTSYLNIIKKIQNIDLNNTTCKEAFDILYNIQQKLNSMQ